jgi:hypothetical protein
VLDWEALASEAILWHLEATYSVFIPSATLSKQNFCSIEFNHSSAWSGSSASRKIGGSVSKKFL